jgi:hypothetical protein
MSNEGQILISALVPRQAPNKKGSFNQSLLLSLILLLLNSIVSFGQNSLTGTVISARDSIPLSGASVFVNSSSIGTSTDNNGEFLLPGITVLNFELVISFVGFETVVIKVGAETINRRYKIIMQPKPAEIAEVVVGGVIKDGWKRWGSAFTANFIGTSANSFQCVIKNPEVLRFRYDKKTETVRVSSIDKLTIQNKALGLTVQYQLEEFFMNGSEGTVTYAGYLSFEKMEGYSQRKENKWVKERMKAYNGSLMHFIRSIYNKSVEQDGFEVRQLLRLRKTDSALLPYYKRIMSGDYSAYDTSKFALQLMKDGSGRSTAPIIYLIGKNILPADSIRFYDTARKSIYLSFAGDLSVTYKNELEAVEYRGSLAGKQRLQESVLQLINNRAVLIEKNGLHYEPLDLFTEGYWAWEKVSEMLPADYQPGD